MRNQLQTFLLEEDEKAYSKQLRLADPTIFFIDQDEAGQGSVRLKTCLLDCNSGYAWVWRSGNTDPAESAELWRTQINTQSLTATMQFMRSRQIETEYANSQKASAIKGGRVAACYSGRGTNAQLHLKRLAYDAIDAVTTEHVVQVDPIRRQPIGSSRDLRAGERAAAWCCEGNHILVDSSTKHLYYLPESATQAL